VERHPPGRKEKSSRAGNIFKTSSLLDLVKLENLLSPDWSAVANQVVNPHKHLRTGSYKMQIGQAELKMMH
jgi:hypothetical protein